MGWGDKRRDWKSVEEKKETKLDWWKRGGKLDWRRRQNMMRENEMILKRGVEMNW